MLSCASMSVVVTVVDSALAIAIVICPISIATRITIDVLRELSNAAINPEQYGRRSTSRIRI